MDADDSAEREGYLGSLRWSVVEDQLRWLRYALTQAPAWATDDREMLAQLRRGFDHDDRAAVIRELERRLAHWPAARHRAAALALQRAHERDDVPSRAAQRTDQLLVRLLHQVRGAQARRLALDCLSAPRRLRRRAAWRFFTVQGLDSVALEVLREADPEPDPMYVRLVAPNPEALKAVGLERALECVDSFYWRSRALQSALGVDVAAVRRSADDYPAEALFALRNAGRRDQLDLARGLLDRHGDAIDVLTNAIRCFAALQAYEELRTALARGHDLLARETRSHALRGRSLSAGPGA